MALHRIRALAAVVTLLAALVISFSPSQPAQAAIFEVNEANDAASDGTCDATCTLRDAIGDANATVAEDEIRFFINSGVGNATLTVNTPLPAITRPVTINGLTQNAFVSFCGDVESTVPTVVLQAGAAGFSGLVFEDTASNSTVRGLVINSFSGLDTAGVFIRGDGVRLECNFIGTDINGTTAVPNTNGVLIDGGANNIIGALDRGNLISGNTSFGVVIRAVGSTNNTVQDNTVGLNRSASLPLANGTAGVYLTSAPGNGVFDNRIAGNPDGVFIEGSQSSANVLQGNIIGLNGAGDAVVAGGVYGVRIADAPDTLVGGSNPLDRNIISGHSTHGVLITGVNATGNEVAGNYVGTDITGSVDLGNTHSGVVIQGATGNTIGGGAEEAGNVISGNNQFGIYLLGNADNNQLLFNVVGLNAGRSAALPNLSGIVLDGAVNNAVGVLGSGNIVAGNSSRGITLANLDTTANTLTGNYIGQDNFGNIFPNGNYGIRIIGAFDNTVQDNVITNNPSSGVFVGGNGAGNRIQGNRITENGGLGIDLSNTLDADGITPNDADDTDTGTNDLINFPVLTAGRGTNDYTFIQGTLDGPAGALMYRLDFYGNTVCDISGNGEGDRFIGTLNVTTDAAGDATFSTSALLDVNSGDFVTVTTTTPANDTSEFSACVQVTDAPQYGADVLNGATITLSTLVSVPTETTITANNGSGRADLEITSVTLSNTTQFTLVAPLPAALPITIAPGDPAINNTVLRVRCENPTTGTFTTTVTVLTNDPAQPVGGFTYTINCEVNTGVAPIYDSDPDPGQTITLNTPFGTPLDATIVVRNLGTDTLTVSSIALTDTTNFVLSAPATGAFQIFSGTGVEVDIVIRCEATVVGSHTTTVTVNHNATGSPATYTINCNVSGAPQYVSNPVAGSTTSRSTPLGTALDIPIRVTNPGTSDLLITDVTLTPTTGFLLTTGTTYTVLSGGVDEATINIRCTAAAAGSFSTTVTVTHNAAGSPTTYTINCTVTTPEYTSTPAPGGAPITLTTVRGTPVTTTIQARNDAAATADLQITGIVLSDAVNFSLNPNTTTYTLTPGGTANIVVQCNATTEVGSPFTTTVTVSTNDPDEPAGGYVYTVQCTVTVPTAPSYTSTPAPGDTISLATTQGTEVSATISVFNSTGTADLEITNVTLTPGTGFRLDSGTTYTVDFSGTDQADIIIACTAATAGSFSTTVSVTHNAAGSPTTYTLNCDVAAVGTPGYGSTPAPGAVLNRTTAFGVPVSETINVREIGDADLQITNIVLSDPTNFQLTTPTSFTITNGTVATTPITVECRATAVGAQTTTITVSHNAGADAVYTFNCTVLGAGYRSTPPEGSTIPSTDTTDAVITVEEDGDVDLDVLTITLSNTTDFALGTTAPFTILNGSGVTEDIIIACTATNPVGSPYTTTVTVTTNDPSQPVGGFTYTVTCTIAPPAAPIYTSNPVSGGPAITLTTVRGVPVTTSIVAGNDAAATADLQISSIVLSDPVNFSLNPNTTTYTLTPGSTANIGVQCNATTEVGSPFTTNVTVNHNAAGSPATYTIACTVTPPAVPVYTSNPAVGSPTITLSTVQGVPVSTQITAFNTTGTANLNITNVTLTPATGYTLTSGTTYTVTPNGTPANIAIRCDATTTAGSPFGTTVAVFTNDPTQPAGGYTYTITCTVTPPTGPRIRTTPAPGPAINLSTIVGAAVTTNITVEEIGDAALNVGPITLSTTAQFALLTPPSFVIADGGGSQLITVRCLATAIGNYQTILTIPSNDATRPTVTYTINCAVTAAGAPIYSSSPAPGGIITFPAALVGTTVTTSLAVNNVGSATLTVSVPGTGAITGANAADFSILQNGPPFSIAPAGQTRLITLRCIPLAVGGRVAALSFTTNDLARTTVTYTLSCTGVTVLPTPTPQIGLVPTQPPIAIGGTPVAVAPVPFTGTVSATVRGLAGRSGPYLGASLFRVVRPGATYPILGRSRDEGGEYTWYLITVTGRNVWVSGRYFEVGGSEALVPELTTIFDQIDDAPDVGMTVITRSFTDLRRRPSPRAAIVTSVPPNTRMTLIGRTTQNRGDWWYHVRFDDAEAWIPAYAIIRGGNTGQVPVR